MEALSYPIIAIGVLLVLFSILGVKLPKKPKLKKLDPKKSWGKDLDQWCIRNPNAKIVLVWLAQTSVQFFQLVWWLISGLFMGILKKALKH